VESRQDPKPALTLGDVLYAGASSRLVAEREWVELVRSVAVGSQTALQSLFVRAQAAVYTLAMRITGQSAAAQEATLDTFQQVWRSAGRFDEQATTVLAWIMGHARARALHHSGGRSVRGPLGDPERPLLQAPERLRYRLAERIAQESHRVAILPPPFAWSEPDLREVAPGISCKLLANDQERHRISMLVRMLPGISYPPHAHAGREELHLLQGELWIEDRKLLPGDYNRAEAPSADAHVWSETGCACVLVTSTDDLLQ
jgi:DNA-directed RNA polymerase specialized sigma24 family protein